MAHLFLYIAPSFRISIAIFSIAQQNILECTECDFKCLSNQNYKMHLFQQSTEMPFSCTECDFSHREHTVCISVHTGEFSRPTLICDYIHIIIKVILLIFIRKNYISNG